MDEWIDGFWIFSSYLLPPGLVASVQRLSGPSSRGIRLDPMSGSRGSCTERVEGLSWPHKDRGVEVWMETKTMGGTGLRGEKEEGVWATAPMVGPGSMSCKGASGGRDSSSSLPPPAELLLLLLLLCGAAVKDAGCPLGGDVAEALSLLPAFPLPSTPTQLGPVPASALPLFAVCGGQLVPPGVARGSTASLPPPLSPPSPPAPAFNSWTLEVFGGKLVHGPKQSPSCSSSMSGGRTGFP